MLITMTVGQITFNSEIHPMVSDDGWNPQDAPVGVEGKHLIHDFWATLTKLRPNWEIKKVFIVLSELFEWNASNSHPMAGESPPAAPFFPHSAPCLFMPFPHWMSHIANSTFVASQCESLHHHQWQRMISLQPINRGGCGLAPGWSACQPLLTVNTVDHCCCSISMILLVIQCGLWVIRRNHKLQPNLSLGHKWPNLLIGTPGKKSLRSFAPFLVPEILLCFRQMWHQMTRGPRCGKWLILGNGNSHFHSFLTSGFCQSLPGRKPSQSVPHSFDWSSTTADVAVDHALRSFKRSDQNVPLTRPGLSLVRRVNFKVQYFQGWTFRMKACPIFFGQNSALKQSSTCMLLYKSYIHNCMVRQPSPNSYWILRTGYKWVEVMGWNFETRQLLEWRAVPWFRCESTDVQLKYDSNQRKISYNACPSRSWTRRVIYFFSLFHASLVFWRPWCTYTTPTGDPKHMSLHTRRRVSIVSMLLLKQEPPQLHHEKTGDWRSATCCCVSVTTAKQELERPRTLKTLKKRGERQEYSLSSSFGFLSLSR